MSPPSVAALLRERLKAKDLTQAELASLTRLHRMTIHYLVNGKTRLTTNTAPRIAKVLGETAQWWLRKQIDADFQEGT